MTRLTKLAVTIALGLQSLGAMATSGQSDKLSKGARELEEAKLESKEDVLGDFLNDLVKKSDRSQTDSTEGMKSSSEKSLERMFEGEMTEDQAEAVVEAAIDTLDDDTKTEAETLFGEEKFNELEELFMNNIGVDSDINGQELFEALALLEGETGSSEGNFMISEAPALLEEETGSSEANVMVSPERKFEGDMTKDQAKAVVEGAIAKIYDDDDKTKAAALLGEEKFNELEELLMNNTGFDEMLLNALALLEEETGSSEDNAMTSPERMFEGEMTEDQAEAVVEAAIDTLDDDTKTEATTLFGEEKFNELEEFFMNNIGVDSDINGQELFEALALLEEETGSPLEDEFEDSSNEHEVNEEEQLSELKEVLATTQEELEELLSRINNV